MTLPERQRLVEHVGHRIAELEKMFANEDPLAVKKQRQSDDAAADMDLTIQAPINDKIMQNHQQELSQLQQSFAWLKSDHAGYCDQCGSEIPVARLMAALGSRLCLSCAETKNS
ncbi:MAG: TraR/DksA C4-type zinc finger protein [Cycloclasticus sp.]|nr:TraR/DksA C4-type zinc finger protein [Cycloclasticus sp.]MBQ0789724.1 TraR/DksA C4-type zinc finger protein [Cycloclasticus sp.]